MLSGSMGSAVADKEARSELAVPAKPWLERRDVVVVGLILAFGAIGFCLSEKRWPTLARWFAERRLRRAAKFTFEERRTIEVIVGSHKDEWIEESFRRRWLQHKYLSWIQMLACYQPWGWRPRPNMIGQRYLDEALAEGRGVILLTANFAYKDLMTKAALAKAGYQACHLKRDSHGFAESRLGKRLLNPIHTRIEGRYLSESLVFSGNQTTEVNGLIKERLRQNRVIFVTVTPIGRRVSVLPFLHGRIRIATGALNFACETGAAILPIFTIRRPDGSIDTIIEPPLSGQNEGTRATTIQAMLEDYVPRLETYVAQFPDQFGFPASSRHGQMLIEPAADASAKTARPCNMARRSRNRHDI